MIVAGIMFHAPDPHNCLDVLITPPHGTRLHACTTYLPINSRSTGSDRGANFRIDPGAQRNLVPHCTYDGIMTYLQTF